MPRRTAAAAPPLQRYLAALDELYAARRVEGGPSLGSGRRAGKAETALAAAREEMTPAECVRADRREAELNDGYRAWLATLPAVAPASAGDMRTAPAPEPTGALPGSEAKVVELQRRARTRLDLHADEDADEDERQALQAVKQRNGAAKQREGGMRVVGEKARPGPPGKKFGTAVPHPASFASRLCGLRQARGLTRKALAFRAGVTPRAVRFWETGQRRPGWERAKQLATVLGVGLDVLAGQESARRHT